MGTFDTEKLWFETLSLEEMERELRYAQSTRIQRLRPVMDAKRQRPQQNQPPPQASN